MEKMIDGHTRFFFYDNDGNLLVAMHWQHRFNHMVGRYNDIYRVQIPNIIPHICRHTYCSNQAKADMNPKTLHYLMGHSDVGVAMSTYTHLGLDDAKNQMIRMEKLEQARKEVLDYGLSFPNTYQDAPFHDYNWILVRLHKNKKLSCGLMKEVDNCASI